MVEINNDWDDILKEEFEKQYMTDLMTFIENEYKTKNIFPEKQNLFNALRHTPFSEVKVVIIGQDPYHQKGQAHGFCFSVREGTKIPPSLRNIFKEIESSTGQIPQISGDLTYLAEQGVLLLNSILTVEEGKPLSHKNIGWEKLTYQIISAIDKKDKPVVFMLWGNNAKEKEMLIKNKSLLILKSVHPSPLSAYGGFFGCNHFNTANEFLISNGMTAINWSKC